MNKPQKQLKPNYYNPTKEVREYAKENDLDTITACAKLSAKEVGITDEEMPKFEKLFHEYMANRLTAEQSLTFALNEIILELPKK